MPNLGNYLNESMIYANKIGGQFERANIYTSLAENYLGLNDFSSATVYADSAVAISKRLNLLESLKASNKIKIKILAKQKDFQQAYTLAVFNDSIENRLTKMEDKKNVQELDVKYEVKKKDALNVQKDAVIKLTKAKSNTYLLLGFLATIAALVFFFLFYKIQKQNKLIENQKQEIFHNNSNSLKQLINIFKNQSNGESNAIENQQRVEALSILNRMLYENGGNSSANLNDYLPALCNVKKITTDNKVDIQVVASSINLGFNQLKDLGLIVNELTMNAIKYAFAGIEKPLIKISATENGSYLNLVVHDNGNGYIENQIVDSEASGFGLKFVKLLVDQYDGTLNITNDNGAKFDISIKKIASKLP